MQPRLPGDEGVSKRPVIFTCAKCKKKAYPNERIAIRFALRYSYRRAVPLRVYHNPACGAWHLTHKEKK